MGALELRNKIIELLNTNNVSYLEEVLAFAKKSQTQDSSAIEELPTPIQELLQESIKQADRGELISHDVVMEEARKKYNLTK